MGDVPRVTLQTVADRVGVSRMTVSNAFNRPDQLSAAMRERILATAEELGYSGPDPTARALVRGSAGAVGVLLTDDLAYGFRDGVATEFLAAVADELRTTGLSMTLLSTRTYGDLVPVRDVALDGVIVFSCTLDTSHRDWLRRRGVPLVLVDQRPDPSQPGVRLDDRGGARLAAEHVGGLGHRRIGVLLTGGREDLRGEVESPREAAAELKHTSAQRLLGWLDVLEEAGAEVVVRHIGRHDHDEALAEAGALLDLPERPTAVLCYSDVVAVGALQAAEERGISVPQQLSLVGFDDNPLAIRVRPTLTTVRQDAYAKGVHATRALLASIAAVREGRAVEAEQVLLPTELVVRDSSGPAPR